MGTRQDVTTTSCSSLDLRKEVKNVTQGGAWVLSNQARDGDELDYRITYTNNASTAIANLVIRDMTPAFTVFVSAACIAPLPATLTSCTVTQPAPLTANGSIQWQFSGTLAGGGSGVVTYRVKVQ